MNNIPRTDTQYQFYDLFENTFEVSHDLKKKLCNFINDSNFNRYPEMSYYELRKRLGSTLGLPPESFVFSNGSGDLLKHILEASLCSGDEILCNAPTWIGLTGIARKRGYSLKEIPMNFDQMAIKHNLDKLASSVTNRTKMIYLVNPTLPGGVALLEQDFSDFLSRIPEHIPIILDEAYIEFSLRKEVVKSHLVIKKFPHQIIGLRSFSKFYGLAALRIGYAFTLNYPIGKLQALIPHFALNSISTAAACIMLDNDTYKVNMLKTLTEETEWVTKELAKLKFPHLKSDFHYALIQPSGDDKQILDFFNDHKVVLPRELFLDQFLHFPISKHSHNQLNIDLLKSYLSKA